MGDIGLVAMVDTAADAVVIVVLVLSSWGTYIPQRVLLAPLFVGGRHRLKIGLLVGVRECMAPDQQ